MNIEDPIAPALKKLKERAIRIIKDRMKLEEKMRENKCNAMATQVHKETVSRALAYAKLFQDYKTFGNLIKETDDLPF